MICDLYKEMYVVKNVQLIEHELPEYGEVSFNNR
jgi:hypothetical protein